MRTREVTEWCACWGQIARDVHQNALDKGFWEGDSNRGEKLMLIVSEIAEAMEAERSGGAVRSSDKIGSYSEVEEELADAVIRIMDYGERFELNIPRAIVAKHQYNLTRPYKHGKLF